MIQRQRKLDRDVCACPTCGAQPKLYEVSGPGLLFLECSPCRIQTPRLRKLADVVTAWGKGQTVRQPLKAVA